MSSSLKVFLSHKTATHGNAAQILSNILYEALDKDRKAKLDIFCSPDLKPGERWRQIIYEKLKCADVLIVLYLAEGENVKMAWCDFEAGFYEGFTCTLEREKRKIVPVVREGGNPPDPLREYEVIYVNYQGIKELLNIIYNFEEEEKKVYPKIFDKDKEKELDSLIKKILESLSAFIRETITPRLWITVSTALADKIRKGEYIKKEDLSDVHLRGESEALREFGIGPKEGVTFREFYQQSFYQESLNYFIPHLISTLKRILNENFDDLFLPPIRVTDSGYARTLVPAYIERTPDQNIRFEFFVYRPIPSFNVQKPSPFDTLFNLFVIAWRFRWLLIEKNFSNLLDLKPYFDQKIREPEIRDNLEKIRIGVTLILLDSRNRGLGARKIKKVIGDDSDREQFDKIVDTKSGIWAQYQAELFSAIDDNNPKKVIEIMEKMIPINKEILLISLRGLLKEAEELEENPEKI